MVFPVVMYGCESWSMKKAEHRRFDAFELWYWRRLLRVPLTARRSNQSILKEISPECSLEGLMFKLKLQYFVHLMQRADSFQRSRCWERLKVGGAGDYRGWDGWMTSPTKGTWVWINSRSWWKTGRPGVLWSMGSQGAGHNWVTDMIYLCQFSELNWYLLKNHLKTERVPSGPPLPQHAFWDSLGTRWVIPGHKTMDMNLKERQLFKQMQSFIFVA